MSLENAAKIMETLRAAEREPLQIASQMLNELAGLVQSDGDQRLEIEEARSSTFLAICEIGKALHADSLRTSYGQGRPRRQNVGWRWRNDGR
jgi:hypothetical protein